MTESLRPVKGGFLRPFGCGWFIRQYLAGAGPEGSTPYHMVTCGLAISVGRALRDVNRSNMVDDARDTRGGDVYD